MEPFEWARLPANHFTTVTESQAWNIKRSHDLSNVHSWLPGHPLYISVRAPRFQQDFFNWKGQSRWESAEGIEHNMLPLLQRSLFLFGCSCHSHSHKIPLCRYPCLLPTHLKPMTLFLRRSLLGTRPLQTGNSSSENKVNNTVGVGRYTCYAPLSSTHVTSTQGPLVKTPSSSFSPAPYSRPYFEFTYKVIFLTQIPTIFSI